MYLLARFFQYSDILLVPLCVALLFLFLRARAERNEERRVKKLYYSFFWYKLFFVLAFTLLGEYYFKGGDTGLYYQAAKDMRKAISDDPDFIGHIARSMKVDNYDPLAPYFAFDNYEDNNVLGYMRSPSNFLVPKLALIPALLFNNSYLCICLFFSFFAIGGAIRLFKTFYHYFPRYWKAIALAVLFLPDVCYWSSGLLKDTICFGCIGYICYAVLSIFVRRKNIISSIIWIAVCSFLLFYIKAYIFLVLIIALIIWQFAEFNKIITDKTMRRVFAGFTFTIGGLIAFFLIRYLTSQEIAVGYQLDKLLEQSASQRQQYGVVAEDVEGSYFDIGSTNPVILMLNGIIATFFRPFPWEISSPIMLFSAIEAILFLSLTVWFFIKKGVGKFFSVAFSDPLILMCFIFSFGFAMAVGSTTTNFGALSRYKIPCMPFYFLMVLLLYRKEELPYPGWLSRILGFFKD
ncbi:MAG: hypothetical protein ABW019_08330 [Chitinophagaceae bacterium]